MKIRSIVSVTVIAACLATVVALGSYRSSPRSGVATGGTGARVARQASAEPVPSTNVGAAGTRLADAAWRTPSAPSPPYAGPDEIERQIAQFFAEQPGLAVVSLSSIECGATSCEIALTGTEVNPRYVDAYSGVFGRLLGTRRSDFRILSGGLGTREIAPGAREYVMSFEYQPLVDLSADPVIAARQYAACAAAWRRQTENPTPTDVARRYVEEAERYAALAASVLGEDEAARVAAETRGGPLIRECRL